MTQMYGISVGCILKFKELETGCNFCRRRNEEYVLTVRHVELQLANWTEKQYTNW